SPPLRWAAASRGRRGAPGRAGAPGRNGPRGRATPTPGPRRRGRRREAPRRSGPGSGRRRARGGWRGRGSFEGPGGRDVDEVVALGELLGPGGEAARLELLVEEDRLTVVPHLELRAEA